MSFKEQMAKDAAIFLNNDEFGEVHDIRYDGKLYEEVPCTITRPKEIDRNAPVKDFVQGVYKVTDRFHCKLDAFGGTIPEQGTHIEILEDDFWLKFLVVKAGADVAMINLDLEAFDE